MGFLRRGSDEPFELRGKTLDWINRERVAFRHEPIFDIPQGIPNSAIRCPIALAFEDLFGTGLVMVSPAYLRHAHDQEIITRLPNYVTAFVAVFDDRGYPDLIEDQRPCVPHFLYVPEPWIENYYNAKTRNV